jgi:TP901 family phage tail tape measure protein
VAQLSINLKGSDQNTSATLNNTVKGLERLDAAVDASAMSFKSMAVVVDASGKAMIKYSLENSEATKTALALKTAQTDQAQKTALLRVSQTDLVKTTTELRQTQTDLTRASGTLKIQNQELANATAATRLRMLEQKEAMAQATAETKTATQHGHNLTSALGSLVSPAGLAAGAVGAVAVASVGMAGDFDQAMRELMIATGVTDQTSKTFQDMSATAKQVGKDTKFSSKEAAEGMTAFAQAGLSAEQAMKATAPAAKVAEINHVSLAEAAKIGTVAMNAFGLKAEEMSRIFDVQTKAAALGVLNFDDFGSAMASVGSVAKTANQSLEGTTSVLLALTNNGQSAEDAGTSVKSALLSMINPGKQAADAIDTLGLRIYDAQGKMLPFAEIVTQVEKNTHGWTEEARNQAIAALAGSDGIRAFTGALNAHIDVQKDGKTVTLTGSAALKEMEDQLKNSTGTTDKAAAILREGFNAQLENLGGSLQEAGIAIGTQLIPPLTELIKAVIDVVNGIVEFDKNTKIISTTLTLLATPLKIAADLLHEFNLGLAKGQGEASRVGAEIDSLAKKYGGLQNVSAGVKAEHESYGKVVEYLIKNHQDYSATVFDVFNKTLDFSKGLKGATGAAGDLLTVVGNLGQGVIGSKIVIDQHGAPGVKYYGDTVGKSKDKLVLLNEEIDRLKGKLVESDAATKRAKESMAVMDDSIDQLDPTVGKLWNQFKKYADSAFEGGSQSKYWYDRAQQVLNSVVALDPQMGKLAVAYQQEMLKVVDSNKAHEEYGKKADESKQMSGQLADIMSNKTTKALLEFTDNMPKMLDALLKQQGGLDAAKKKADDAKKGIQDYNTTPVLSKPAQTDFPKAEMEANRAISAIEQYNRTPVYPKTTITTSPTGTSSVQIVNPPGYAEGTPPGGHPGGPAMIGEGQYPELVVGPHFFRDMARGAQVIPLAGGGSTSNQSTVNHHTYNLSANYAYQERESLIDDVKLLQRLSART